VVAGGRWWSLQDIFKISQKCRVFPTLKRPFRR
jgi:hypothetical protein